MLIVFLHVTVKLQQLINKAAYQPHEAIFGVAAKFTEKSEKFSYHRVKPEVFEVQIERKVIFSL